MIYSYLNNRDRVRKKTTQEMRVKKIDNKEKNMPLSSNFRMLSDKWIRKVWVILCKQKKPPEKKIGDRSIIAYFLRDHAEILKEYYHSYVYYGVNSYPVYHILRFFTKNSPHFRKNEGN